MTLSEIMARLVNDERIAARELEKCDTRMKERRAYYTGMTFQVKLAMSYLDKAMRD